MSEKDPLNQLVETLQVLENPNRAICLLAVYLGQRGDQNTIQGITDIYSALLGKNEDATTAKVRGLITALVNNKLLERERERMISKTKVSFHQISPLGEIALLYVTAFLTDNPAEIKMDQSQFASYMAGDSEFKLARFITNSALNTNKQTERIVKSLRDGTAPNKLRSSKPVLINIPKIFTGKSGFITFKILEEILWDYLHSNIGISRTEISSQFDKPIGSNINKLSSFINEDTLGKSKYYRMSTLGIFVLPILAFLIRYYSVDNSILPSLLSTKVDPDKNPWITLTEKATNFFKELYRLA